MIHPDYDYDEIADKIFYPIYDVIADDIQEATGIREGEFLDVGCGGGHLGFSIMKKTGMNGTFVDIHPAAVEITSTRAKELGVSEKCSFREANVEHLPFEDNRFDLIISRGSMPFWQDQRQAFSELFRVLAPGGCTYVGCGLGNTEMQKMIKDKMHENGMKCFGEDKKDRSMALSDEEYAALFSQWNCEFRIINDESKGRWLVIRKGEEK